MKNIKKSDEKKCNDEARSSQYLSGLEIANCPFNIEENVDYCKESPVKIL